MSDLEVRYLSEKYKKLWNGFVKERKECTFYHSLKWKEILEEGFSFKTKYLLVLDSERNVRGILPLVVSKQVLFDKMIPLLERTQSNVLMSLPNSDYGGPVLDDKRMEEVSILLKKSMSKIASTENAIYAMLRFSSPELYKYFYVNRFNIDTSLGTMILDLEKKPTDFIWNRIFTNRKGQRKYIRRFEQKGFQSREAEHRNDLHEFYSLYYNNLIYIKGLPYSISFFQRVWDTLYPRNFNIILMEKEEKCFGALAFFIYENKGTMYLTYLGLDRNVEKRYHISYYLFWEAIKWAEEKTLRFVDFGSTPSNPDSSHHSLKRRFGPVFHQHYIVYSPFNLPLFLIGKGVRNSVKKLFFTKENKVSNFLSDLYHNYVRAKSHSMQPTR